MWRCIRCHGPLKADAPGLRCSGCGKLYPVVDGIFILVGEPAAYLRSELASLSRAYSDARQRLNLLERIGRDADLSKPALDRHRDVNEADIARAETFLALLSPASAALKALAEGGHETGDSLGLQRSGWAFETLLPYLLRDWTHTPEFEAANIVIGRLLKDVVPDPSGKSIAFAGCGAAGLLAGLSPEFEHILGYDLTLPILAAARHLLDGETIDLPMPRSVNSLGRVRLAGGIPPSSRPRVLLSAMDACETAFADGTVDCVITSFLVDLIPDPRTLAEEVHRILSSGGIWINYGPSGTLDSIWRFDQSEGTAFFESTGFTVLEAEARRATYLDLSRDDPMSSYQNHMCYLTAARKAGPGTKKSRPATPDSTAMSYIIPQHFPGANLVHQQSLGADQTRSILLRHERIRGRVESLEIGGDTARILALVDGKRSVGEIADMLQQRNPAHSSDHTLRAFIRFFDQRLLSWREPKR